MINEFIYYRTDGKYEWTLSITDRGGGGGQWMNLWIAEQGRNYEWSYESTSRGEFTLRDHDDVVEKFTTSVSSLLSFSLLERIQLFSWLISLLFSAMSSFLYFFRSLWDFSSFRKTILKKNNLLTIVVLNTVSKTCILTWLIFLPQTYHTFFSTMFRRKTTRTVLSNFVLSKETTENHHIKTALH